VVDVRMPPTHTDEGLRAAITARSHLARRPMLVLTSMWRPLTPPTCSPTAQARFGYLLKDRVSRSRCSWTPWTGSPRGATVLDPQVIAQLLAGQRRDSALETLTARERQLLALMARATPTRPSPSNW